MDNSPAAGLPVELWIKIAIHLQSKISWKYGLSFSESDLFHSHLYFNSASRVRAVKPLSETCRYLHTIIQPILYEIINLDVLNHRNADKMDSIASTLLARPHLQSAVRTIWLYGFLKSNLSDTFLSVLPLLVELRYVSLTSGIITPAIVTFLRNATHLHTLRMSFIAWAEDIPEDWASFGSFGGQLTSLSLSGPSKPDPHRAARNSHLFVPTLTEIIVDSPRVVELMQTHGLPPFSDSLAKFTCITRMVSNREAFRKAIVQLLSHCSKIELLALGKKSWPEFDMDVAFLPELRSLRCLPTLTALHGRPIRCIEMIALPKLFENPLPQIEELHIIEHGDRITGAMLASCPNLVKLDMRCCSVDTRSNCPMKTWIDTTLLTDVAVLPRLQVLHIRWEKYTKIEELPIEQPLSDEMLRERRMIGQMKQHHCPNLSDVWIDPGHAWNYVPADDVWEPRCLIMHGSEHMLL